MKKEKIFSRKKTKQNKQKNNETSQYQSRIRALGEKNLQLMQSDKHVSFIWLHCKLPKYNKKKKKSFSQKTKEIIQLNTKGTKFWQLLKNLTIISCQRSH